MEFKTRKGTTLTLQPISTVLLAKVAAKADMDFDAEHGKPEPPTYETPVGEVVRYDEVAINDELATVEDKAAWARFKALERQKAIFVYTRVTEAYLWLGVTDEPPDDDAWEAQQQAIGIEIPTDQKDKKVHWLRTEILVSDNEAQKLMTEIRKLADPVEVEADIAARTFRDSVAEPAGATP